MKKINEISVDELVTIAQVIQEYENILRQAQEQLFTTQKQIEQLQLILINASNVYKQSSNEITANMKALNKYIVDRTEIEKKLNNNFIIINNTVKEHYEQINKSLTEIKKNTDTQLQNIQQSLLYKVKRYIKTHTAFMLATVVFFICSLLFQTCTLMNIKKEIESKQLKTSFTHVNYVDYNKMYQKTNKTRGY